MPHAVSLRKSLQQQKRGSAPARAQENLRTPRRNPPFVEAWKQHIHDCILAARPCCTRTLPSFPAPLSFPLHCAKADILPIETFGPVDESDPLIGSLLGFAHGPAQSCHIENPPPTGDEPRSASCRAGLKHLHAFHLRGEIKSLDLTPSRDFLRIALGRHHDRQGSLPSPARLDQVKPARDRVPHHAE